MLFNAIGIRALLIFPLVHCTHSEANARKADESSGPTNKTDERITQQYQGYQALQLGKFLHESHSERSEQSRTQATTQNWHYNSMSNKCDLLKPSKTHFNSQSIQTMIWQAIPLLVSFGSFVVAAYIYPKPLTSDIVFPAISLFLLLSFPLAMVR